MYNDIRKGNIMQKKVLSLTLAILIVVACVFGLVACNNDDGEQHSEFAQLQGGRPDYASLFTAEDKALIDKAVAGNVTEDEMKAAVIALYTTANNSRINTPKSLVVQESLANSNAMESVKILMHAFNLRDGNKWYYQLATDVDSGDGFIDDLIAEFGAGYLKVGYCLGTDDNADGETDYYYFGEIGSQFNCDCSPTTFPYATFAFPEGTHPFQESMTLEEFNDTLNVLQSIHEINNMDFCEEIIADGAKITLEDNVYKVTFSVDMNADGDLLEKWFAMPKKDMAVGGQTLTKYNYYNAVLEVWDNGYAKYFESSADREAGMGGGKPIDKYVYFWNEDEIVELVSSDTAIQAYNENNDEGEQINTVDECLSYYTNHDNFQFVPKKLKMTEIFGIAVGCIAAVIIIIVVTIEVLVKKGKLPKLAKRRADNKAKRLAKKNAKKGVNRSLQDEENSADENATEDGGDDKQTAEGAIVIDYTDKLGDKTVFYGEDVVVTRSDEPIDLAFGVTPLDARDDDDKQD